MAHKVKAVVVKAKNAPVEIETIIVPNPGPGEAVVDILTCGVCHTDLHYKLGGIGDDFPYLLGHEATGIVSELGTGVTDLAVGDRVILNWRAVCGSCRACAKGQPQYCFNTANATQKMTLEDGTELSPALGIGAFAEKTLVAAGQCTKVDPDVDPAAVGLLGCGIMAGIGAAINTGEVKRGETVAVIGCGGVGIAAIAGAKLAGATTIIAVDIDPARPNSPSSSAPPTPSTPARPTPSRPSGASPADTAPTSSSTPSDAPKPTSRPSTPATSPAGWSWSGSPPPR